MSLAALSHRELQVATGLAYGEFNREIAARLDISVKTVDTHRSHVMKKLGVRNNAELALFAVREGLVSMFDVETAQT